MKMKGNIYYLVCDVSPSASLAGARSTFNQRIDRIVDVVVQLTVYLFSVFIYRVSMTSLPWSAEEQHKYGQKTYAMANPVGNI